MNCNYMKSRFGDNEIISNYNFKYNITNPPNFNKYKTIYFAGISLDECVTVSRKLSYKNLLHNNKILIKDCCIQGTFKNRKKTKHVKNEYDMINYELSYLKNMKINYIHSLIVPASAPVAALATTSLATTALAPATTLVFHRK